MQKKLLEEYKTKKVTIVLSLLVATVFSTVAHLGTLAEAAETQDTTVSATFDKGDLIFESAPASFQFPNSKLTGTQVTTFVKKTSDLTHLSISDYRGTESGYKLTAIANPIPDKDNNGEELKGSNIFWDSSLMTSPV